MRLVNIIIVLLLLSTFTAQAQVNRTPGRNTDVRIIKVYPNPASAFIYFEFQPNNPLSDYNFSIYNFIGKKVLEINTLTPRTTVDLSEYFRGVYIFQLKDRRTGQILESGKFQVVK